MTKEIKEEIETILNNNDINNIERLKSLVAPFGADVSHGCFCKSSEKQRLLDKIKNWYNNYPNA